jgi:hypothetical protein
MTFKERIHLWRLGRTDGEVIDRPAEELSDAYLEKLQKDIDSKLKKDIKFTSVSRASW